MTVLVIILSGLLCTLFAIWILSVFTESSFKKFTNYLFFGDEFLVFLNVAMLTLMTLVWIITFFAINNTFLHFKY